MGAWVCVSAPMRIHSGNKFRQQAAVASKHTPCDRSMHAWLALPISRLFSAGNSLPSRCNPISFTSSAAHVSVACMKSIHGQDMDAASWPIIVNALLLAAKATPVLPPRSSCATGTLPSPGMCCGEPIDDSVYY